MGQVVFRLDAEESKAVRAFLKTRDAEVKVATAAKKMTDESKKAHRSMISFGEGGLKSMVKLAAGIFGVAKAIGEARRAYQLWDQEQKAIADRAKKYTTDLVEAVSGRGDLARLTEISDFISTSLVGGLTMGQGVQTYAAVGGALPTADYKRVLEITKKSMEARLAGVDPVKFGETMGELVKVFTDKSLDDLADLTKSTMEQVGRYGQRFGRGGVKAVQKFVAEGLGPAEEGLGYVLSSLIGGQGAEGAEQLFIRLAEVKKGGTRLEREFFAAEAPARLKMLRESEEMIDAVFKTQAGGVKAMLAAQPGAIAATLREAQGADIFERAKRQVAADPMAAQVLGIEAIKAAGEKVKHVQAKEVLTYDELMEAIETVGAGIGLSPWYRYWLKGTSKLNWFMGVSPEAEERNLEKLMGFERGGFRQVLGDIKDQRQYMGTQPGGAFGQALTQDDIMTIEKNTDALDRNTRELEKQNQVQQQQQNNFPIAPVGGGRALFLAPDG